MTFWRGAAVAVILWGASATTMQAENSVIGRWAMDLSSCTRLFGSAAEQPLIVSAGALRWFGDACRIARMYKTGDTVHIQALCWGAGGERSIPVSLRPHGGRLVVTWDRGPRGELRRCP